ncbi:MAG: hypothetical protein PUE41_04750 [bacterium]|nr:hypothetical protein [bacterium]
MSWGRCVLKKARKKAPVSDALLLVRKDENQKKHLQRFLSPLIQTSLSAPGSDRIGFRSRAVPPVEFSLLEEFRLL